MRETVDQVGEKSMGKVIRIDEKEIRKHYGRGYLERDVGCRSGRALRSEAL